MFRWAFAAILFIAALSFLLLGLASCRSREIRHDLFTRENHWATVSAFNGQVYLLLNSLADARIRIPMRKIDLGSFQVSSTVNGPLRVTLLVAPFWLPSLLFVLVVGGPLFLLWRRRTWRRLTGHCPACGYSLTGLSEPRCPECGREACFQPIRRIQRILLSRMVAAMLLFLALLPIGWTICSPLRNAVVQKVFGSTGPAVINRPGLNLTLQGWKKIEMGKSTILVSPNETDSILIGPDGTARILSGSNLEGLVEMINRRFPSQSIGPSTPAE